MGFCFFWSGAPPLFRLNSWDVTSQQQWKKGTRKRDNKIGEMGGCYLDVNNDISRAQLHRWQRWHILGKQFWSGDMYICLGYSMNSERVMTFPSPFIFIHTKVAPTFHKFRYLSSLFPSCIVAVMSRSSYLAWKEEEHRTPKKPTYTTPVLFWTRRTLTFGKFSHFLCFFSKKFTNKRL